MKSKILIITASILILTALSIMYLNFNFSTNKKDVSNSSTKVINSFSSNEVTAQQKNSNIEDSLKQSFFVKNDDSSIIRLNGFQGKFGFTEPICYQRKLVSTTLYLWGNEKDILNKQLKIQALNSNGQNLEISNLQKVTKEGHIEYGAKNTIATAKEHLEMELPNDGLWKLNIYLDNTLLGSTIIKVQQNDDNSTILTPLQKN